MSEFKELLSAFTPGAVGVWGILFLYLQWQVREWRENRKLTDADKQARRQGYEKEVAELRTENRNLRADMNASREEHDRYRSVCQQETDSLRQQIMHLQFEKARLERRFDTMAIEVAALAASPVDVGMELMAQRLDDLNAK